MSAVSSAEPLQLYLFASRSSSLGHELLSEASRLSSALSRFEAVCREYPVHVGYLPGSISSHARGGIALADWTRQVGTDFLRADADRFWAWVDRMQLHQKYERALIRYLTLLDQIRNAMSLIAIGALPFAVHNTARAGWVSVRVPGWAKMHPFLGNIKKLGGLEISLTTIPVKSLSGYLNKVLKKAAFLDVLLRWGQDIVTFHENVSKMFSAWAVDALIVGGSAVASIKLGAAAGLGVVAVAALAGLTAPAWLVAGAVVVVTGVAYIAITFVLDKTVRERAIVTLDDKVFDPLGKKIAEGMNTVHSAVDGAARRFKEGWQQMVDFLTPAPPSPAPAPVPAPVPTPMLEPVKLPTLPPIEPVPAGGLFSVTQLPIEVTDGTWTQDFGYTRYHVERPEEAKAAYQNIPGGIHNGLDLGCPVGTPVRSPASISGTVISLNNREWNYGAGPQNVVVDYGKVVMVFGHTGSTDHLTVGQVIEPGEVFVTSGKGENGYAHLHWEVRLKDPEAAPGEKPGGAAYQDPREYLDPEARSRYDTLPGYKGLEPV